MEGFDRLLIKAQSEKWRGALRMKRPQQTGCIWFVNGNAAHAIVAGGNRHAEGLAAFDIISNWTKASYFFEADDLPPDRTIRLDSNSLFERCKSTLNSDGRNKQVSAVNREKMANLLNDLRVTVPGVESISFFRGKKVYDTTISNEIEIEHLKAKMNSYFDKDNEGLRKLFLEGESKSVLVMKKGLYAAIIAADSSASAEDIFKIADKVEKEITQ